MQITDIIKPGSLHKGNPAFDFLDDGTEEIPEGRRNTVMSHIAGKLLIRYGDTPETREMFLKEAERCNPPLEPSELETIFSSAQGFADRVREERAMETQFRPNDWSDIAQAQLFSEFARDRLCYTHGTGYLVYDGTTWEISKSKPRLVYKEFSDLQLDEALGLCRKNEDAMDENGASGLLAMMSEKKAMGTFSREQRRSFFRMKASEDYLAFATRKRNTAGVNAALTESEPLLEIDPALLDADPFLLNTPEGTVNLKQGINGMREHRWHDMITRCTSVAPGDKGREIWEKALHLFFGDDEGLIRYVQMTAGLGLIGSVFVEMLIIAYGEGGNGKSTFWNALRRVLGTYSGSISSSALTVGNKNNIKAELAEIRGRRLLIAAELEEGTRLSTSAVKKLCSTDEVLGERKFYAPMSFKPSHTLVLYTNHLPKVGANDPGTWRRLVVVPFERKISTAEDIKNYADYLVDNAGPAILTWMIEGAKMVIDAEYHIPLPRCVEVATASYRENHDWLEQFLIECCERAEGYSCPSGEFYQEYRSYCMRTGDYTRGAADFYSALEHAGIERKRTKSGRFILGVRLKSEFEPIVH